MVAYKCVMLKVWVQLPALTSLIKRKIYMNYFISDTHFGHDNVIRFCDRPYINADDMDAKLIDNWNSVVTDKDVVYILGDMFFRNSYDPKVILKQLKGRKHLIIGNHDKWITEELRSYFKSIENIKIFKEDKKRFTLCHYPLATFVGDYMIFGHIHNTLNDSLCIELITKTDNLLNACVEINEYKPVTLEQLIKNNKKWKNQ